MSNWRSFYGIGPFGSVASAQAKYLQKYSHLDYKDPQRLAASRALYHAMANHVLATRTALPSHFVHGMEHAVGQSGDTREGRETLIERQMRKGKGPARSPFQSQTPMERARGNYIRKEHLHIQDPSRVRASVDLLRQAATHDPWSLPANFVHSMKYHLDPKYNRASPEELRGLLHKASSSYYNKAEARRGARSIANSAVRKALASNLTHTAFQKAIAANEERTLAHKLTHHAFEKAIDANWERRRQELVARNERDRQRELMEDLRRKNFGNYNRRKQGLIKKKSFFGRLKNSLTSVYPSRLSSLVS